MAVDVRAIRVCLLGASLRAENMGVNALTECSIEAVLHRWPNARFVIVGPRPPQPAIERVRYGDRELEIPVHQFFWPSRQLRHRDAILPLAIRRLFDRVRPRRGVGEARTDQNGSSVLEAILGSDLVLDSSSGDGLSNAYGLRRLLFYVVRKWLVISFGKPLVLLPQSYERIRYPLVRSAASAAVGRSFAVYARDRESLSNAHRLIGSKPEKNGTAVARFVPDLAFILPPRAPCDAGVLERVRMDGESLIGLNVSGLLFHERNFNKFGLRVDYRTIVLSLARSFLEDRRNKLVLIPHVFGRLYENDESACAEVMRTLSGVYNGRIFDLSGYSRSAGEIKYLIGRCDLVLSARMHACIAALSQAIPAVGLAYSSKFKGVFASVGAQHCVFDLRAEALDDILAGAQRIFGERQRISCDLSKRMPRVRTRITTMFDDIELQH